MSKAEEAKERARQAIVGRRYAGCIVLAQDGDKISCRCDCGKFYVASRRSMQNCEAQHRCPKCSEKHYRDRMAGKLESYQLGTIRRWVVGSGDEPWLTKSVLHQE